MPARGGTALTWLRRAAVSNSPKAILRNIEKLEFLKGAGVDRWALDGLSPNRLKRLAQIARRATGQALQRMPEERRYPTPGGLPPPVAGRRRRRDDRPVRPLPGRGVRAGRPRPGGIPRLHGQTDQRDGPALRRAGPRRARPRGPRRPAPTRHLPEDPPERLRKAVEESDRDRPPRGRQRLRLPPEAVRPPPPVRPRVPRGLPRSGRTPTPTRS